MDIILENILNLKGTSVLSREQQQSINGGGSCRTYWPDGTLDNIASVKFSAALVYGTGNRVDFVGMNAKDAEAVALTKPGGRWCCDSCSEASWLQEPVI